jgi:pyruvate/2-oxoglutarate/acetoin dehydrogenase E1 component
MSSVAKTTRVIIVERWRTGSLAAEIGMRIIEQASWSLDAPIGLVCSEEVPIPYFAISIAKRAEFVVHYAQPSLALGLVSPIFRQATKRQ